MLKEDTLNNKAILITGGGSGLGLSMAKCFRRLSAEVVICGRTKERLEKAAIEISDKKDKVHFEVVDVRDYEAVSKMFDNVSAKGIKLNGLVNCAAGNFFSAFEDLTPGGFKAVIDICLLGTFNCSHLFGKRLISDKSKGSILNIVTTYTQSGSAFVVPSACAKAGVQALTNSLAYEWAEYGIRSNSIAPGPFPTKGAWKRLVPDQAVEEKFKALNPMGRFGELNELAELAAYLMSDIAEYINGECITIDGGQRHSRGQFNFLTELYSRQELKEIFKKMRG